MALSDRNDVITEIFRARAVFLGSPCLNGGLLPTLTPILEDLKGLKFKNKIGAAFGSYGWSGENVKRIERELKDAGIPLAAPGVLAKWQPDPDSLEQCRILGRKVAEIL
jgi:flavorubredoxin